MTTLITGGRGFLGRAVATSLAAVGEQVIAADRTPAIATVPGVVDVVADTTETSTVAAILREHRVDRVIHGAAIVGVAAGNQSFNDTLSVNIGGTNAVMQACAEFGRIRRFVDLSSEETYGDFTLDPQPETGPLAPISVYGITKVTTEHLGRYYQRTRGLPYVAARLCWVYGPHFPRQRLPHTWLNDAAAGLSSTLAAGGDQRIDFTYLTDAADALTRLVTADTLAHSAYNVGTGIAATMRQLADLIHSLEPGWSVDLGDGPIRLPDGDRSAHKGAMGITRITTELGWTPRVALADGLARTLDWIRTQPGG